MSGEPPVSDICIKCGVNPQMDADYKVCFWCYDEGRRMAERILASPPLKNYAEEYNDET